MSQSQKNKKKTFKDPIKQAEINKIKSENLKLKTGLLSNAHKEIEKRDLNGNFICRYVSIKEAIQQNNTYSSLMWKHLNNKVDNINGFRYNKLFK